MRILSFLIAILILTGCAHNRIRYVKVDRHQTVVDTAPDQKKNANYSQRNEVAFSETTSDLEESQLTSATPLDTKSDAIVEKEDANIPLEKTPQPADTIRVNSDEYKVMKAEEAEQNALKARNLFIVTLGMMVLPIVSIFALIPFIIGSVRLSRAKNSQFITPFGQKQQRIATILQWIYAGILILGIVLLTVIVVVFLL